MSLQETPEFVTREREREAPRLAGEREGRGGEAELLEHLRGWLWIHVCGKFS